jgi:PmbA protein
MMLEIAEKALELTKKSGADNVEAFVGENLITTVRIAASRVIETKKVHDYGIGIRAAIGQKVGFSSANSLGQELIERAVSIARARPPNSDFNGFPEAAKPKKVSDICDRALLKLQSARASELADLMLQAALDFDRRVVDVSGALNVVVERCAVANTNGLAGADETTRIFGHLTVGSRGVGESEGGAWLGSTSLHGFNPREVGKRAAEIAVNSLGPKKVKPGKYNVILEPAAVAELFYHVFGYAVNGREVRDRYSYFTDKLGKVVAAEGLNIYDWGNMAGGLCSKTFDDEGVPTSRTPLIEHGKLVSFIYDRRYAGKANADSTGNGLRLIDMPGRYYGVEPSPYITNLAIEPGDLKREELIADTEDGLLLSRIWYTYPITPQLGDFSTTSRCGFLINNGEMVGAVQQVRIHENLPRLLKQITGIASDVKQIMPWGASGAICAPSLRFRGVRIS